MKTKLFILSTLALIFSLAACSTPPPEPTVQEVQQESVLEPVVEQATEAVSLSATNTPAPTEPTVVPIPQDYPTPEVAVAEGYPEPEAVAQVESGYPEPAADAEAEADAQAEAEVEDSAEAIPVSSEVIIPMLGEEFGLFGTLNSNGSGNPQPAVLLLHMVGGSRSDWDQTGFNQILNEQGYATLALDLRGHGDSIAAVDWPLAEEDLLTVWEWFISQPEVDGANSMIVGASIGSNLALRTAANISSVKAAVLLSPGLNYFGVTTDDAIALMDRPVLMVAMTADTPSAQAVTELNTINPDNSTAEIEEGRAHGTQMFGTYPGLEEMILDFLNNAQG